MNTKNRLVDIALRLLFAILTLSCGYLITNVFLINVLKMKFHMLGEAQVWGLILIGILYGILITIFIKETDRNEWTLISPIGYAAGYMLTLVGMALVKTAIENAVFGLGPFISVHAGYKHIILILAYAGWGALFLVSVTREGDMTVKEARRVIASSRPHKARQIKIPKLKSSHSGKTRC